MPVLHHGVSRKVQDCQGQGIENLSPLFVESVYHEAHDGASDLVLGGHAMDKGQRFCKRKGACKLD
jgi:hypothetical protein